MQQRRPERLAETCRTRHQPAAATLAKHGNATSRTPSGVSKASRLVERRQVLQHQAAHPTPSAANAQAVNTSSAGNTCPSPSSAVKRIQMRPGAAHAFRRILRQPHPTYLSRDEYMHHLRSPAAVRSTRSVRKPCSPKRSAAEANRRAGVCADGSMAAAGKVSRALHQHELPATRSKGRIGRRPHPPHRQKSQAAQSESTAAAALQPSPQRSVARKPRKQRHLPLLPHLRHTPRNRRTDSSRTSASRNSINSAVGCLLRQQPASMLLPIPSFGRKLLASATSFTRASRSPQSQPPSPPSDRVEASSQHQHLKRHVLRSLSTLSTQSPQCSPPHCAQESAPQRAHSLPARMRQARNTVADSPQTDSRRNRRTEQTSTLQLPAAPAATPWPHSSDAAYDPARQAFA